MPQEVLKQKDKNELNIIKMPFELVVYLEIMKDFNCNLILAYSIFLKNVRS